MGTNINEVGGGPSVGLANDFVKWLQTGLNTGTFGGGPTADTGPAKPSWVDNPWKEKKWNKMAAGAKPQQTAGDNFNRANPMQSTQGVAGVINDWLKGDFGSTEYKTDTSGLTAAGAKPAFNFAAWDPTRTDMSGVNTNALKMFNPNITTGAAPGSIAGNQDFMSGVNRLFGMSGDPGTTITQPGDVNFSLGNVDLSPYQALWDRRTAETVADTRARFGAAGGASFGTPAAFAEANARGEMAAQESAAMADIGRQQQALELQRQAAAAGINAQNFGTWANAFNQGRQINLQAASQGVGQLAEALGMDQQTMLNVRGQDLQAAIANGQLSLEALTAATGFDAQLIDMALRENLSLQEMFNSYQATQASTAIADKGLNLDAISKALGIQQGDNALNQNTALANQQTQLNLINTIMSALQNMSLPGIAPRQNVATPSAGANVLNAASSFAPVIPGYGGKGK